MRTEDFIAAAADGSNSPTWFTPTNFVNLKRRDLVRNSWESVRHSLVHCDTFLDVVCTDNDENDPETWSIIGDALTLLHRCTEGNDRERMERWIRDLLRPHFLKLGWGRHLYEPNSSESTHGILAELLGTIGGDEQVREKCASLFNWWQACHAAVEECLLPALVNSIADSGAEEQYVEFVKLAQRANSARERRLFLEALGRFSSFDCETAMNTVLATATSDDQVLPILSAYVRTEGSAESALHYIKKHWREIWLRFPPPSVLALLKSCSSLDTAPLQRELNDFFFHKILPPVEPGVPKGTHGAQDIVDTLVTVAANVHLRAQGGRAVARYLNLHGGGLSFSQS